MGEEKIMVRLIMLFSVILVVLLQFIDQAMVRPLTAQKSVNAVYISNGSITSLAVETQEVVNHVSVKMFAEDAVVTIFNYRPGLADDHINQDSIKDLFITKEHFDRFAVKFKVWSKYEFSVNNISIKEAISKQGRLTIAPSPQASGGSRIWRYKSNLPTLDRGVGDNVLSALIITVDMVYLGASGGMGIYRIKVAT
jgi:hypothetical protein